jgi:hypothetical protein
MSKCQQAIEDFRRGSQWGLSFQCLQLRQLDPRSATLLHSRPELVEGYNGNGAFIRSDRLESLTTARMPAQNRHAEIRVEKAFHRSQSGATGSPPCSGRENPLSPIRMNSKYPAGQHFGLVGRISTPSPQRSISTFPAGRRISLGIRTACERPFMKRVVVISLLSKINRAEAQRRRGNTKKGQKPRRLHPILSVNSRISELPKSCPIFAFPLENLFSASLHLCGRTCIGQE